MPRIASVLLAALLAAIPAARLRADDPAAIVPRIDAARMKANLAALASDAMNGRSFRSEDGRRAAEWIAAKLAEAGAKPLEGRDSMLVPVARMPAASPNVVAWIPPAGGNPSGEYILVTAHYDHLPNARAGDDRIFNGADDNASGVAAVLELAYRLKLAKLQRSVIVVAFSGEEQGLWGSNDLAKKLAALPVKPAAMVNMDMVGRLGATRQLALYGVGTSPAWPTALAAAGAADRFRLKIDSSGVGPSDHTSFYLTDVPVLHLFTGQHADYHQPSDDAHLINYEGLAEVVELVEAVIRDLDSRPEIPFTKTKSSTSDTPRFKVTLGVVPDYLYDGQGMRIDGTTDGKPAARAGLQRGDVVVALGPHTITNMTGYMEALAKFEPGAETTVTVLRDGKELTLTLRF